jgi:hypothetical protein
VGAYVLQLSILWSMTNKQLYSRVLRGTIPTLRIQLIEPTCPSQLEYVIQFNLPINAKTSFLTAASIALSNSGSFFVKTLAVLQVGDPSILILPNSLLRKTLEDEYDGL